jgi:hypothetical protein
VTPCVFGVLIAPRGYRSIQVRSNSGHVAVAKDLNDLEVRRGGG